MCLSHEMRNLTLKPTYVRCLLSIQSHLFHFNSYFINFVSVKMRLGLKRDAFNLDIKWYVTILDRIICGLVLRMVNGLILVTMACGCGSQNFSVEWRSTVAPPVIIMWGHLTGPPTPQVRWTRTGSTSPASWRLCPISRGIYWQYTSWINWEGSYCCVRN